MTLRTPRGWLFVMMVTAIAAVAGAARADTDTLGPVTVFATNCGDRMSVNLMIYVCANTTRCDYAVGVNNYSGAPISYTVKIDAPPNYKVYEQGQRTSKNYDSFRVVQAPQNANSPPVKVGLTCPRTNGPTR